MKFLAFSKSAKCSVIRRWLLPSLIARILIPIGFMPGNLWAGEYLVPCPTAMPESIFHLGEVSAEAHGEVKGHVNHHEHHHGDDDADLLGAERQCPLGLLLGTTLAATSLTQDAPAPSAEQYLAVGAVLVPKRAAIRLYWSRAPPSFG